MVGLAYRSAGHFPPNALMLGFILSTFGNKIGGLKTSLSMTYLPRRNSISAMLLGESDEALSWVEQDLKCHKTLADNPFLLPFLFCRRFADAISRSLDEQFDLLHQIEMDSGQTGILLVDVRGRVVPRREGREDDLSLEILGVAQRAAAIEASARGHLLTVESVRTELSEFMWPEEVSGAKFERRDAQNMFIGKRLDYITRRVQFSVLRVSNLKERANVQATAVSV